MGGETKRCVAPGKKRFLKILLCLYDYKLCIEQD